MSKVNRKEKKGNDPRDAAQKQKEVNKHTSFPLIFL